MHVLIEQLQLPMSKEVATWFILFAAVMSFNTISFVFCYFLMNDISIIDITWGIMFMISSYFIIGEKMFLRNEVVLSQVQCLTLFMVTFWALRLIAHLASRYNGKEDWRYTNVIRERWSGLNSVGKAVMCYFYLFMNQGILSLLINGSAMHILLNSTSDDKVNDPVVILGACVWAIGFIFEFFGDLQMLDHRDIPKNKGKILKTGLWRYSRHPNYFGEILCWWGVYIVACSGNSLRTGGQYTIYAPLLITFSLTCISGVPMLEKRSKMKSKEFRLYMEETSCVIPWFPRTIEGKERTKLLQQFEKDIKEEAKQESKKDRSGLLYWIKYYLLIE